MPLEPVSAIDHPRIVANVPFVKALARRMASSMARSVDLGDLVQDGVLGLIDAARRFDASRGIDFQTFAERRVRGAMIDALRRHAWPRGVRRQRRDVDAARAALRVELGHEPEVAELAARVGLSERRLRRLMARIHTLEALSPLVTGRRDERALPTALMPSPVESPHHAYEQHETRRRIQQAMASLPAREHQVIARYYYGDVTMKDIGVALGVNESRVSQLHTRAIRHLRAALNAIECPCPPDPRVNADDAPWEAAVHRDLPDDSRRGIRRRLNG